MHNSFASTKVWKPEGRGFSMGLVQPQGKIVHLTGQVAWDEHNRIVGEQDVRTQSQRCFDNIRFLLQEVGGELQDIVSLTTYFIDLDHLPAIQEIRAKVFRGSPGPVSTSVRVAGLGDPAFLVELTPIAVIPFERFHEASV